MAHKKQYRSKKEPRRNRVTVMFNDSEMRVIQRFCSRYKFRSRSHAIREMLMRNILRQFDKDNPTLFDL